MGLEGQFEDCFPCTVYKLLKFSPSLSHTVSPTAITRCAGVCILYMCACVCVCVCMGFFGLFAEEILSNNLHIWSASACANIRESQRNRNGVYVCICMCMYIIWLLINNLVCKYIIVCVCVCVLYVCICAFVGNYISWLITMESEPYLLCKWGALVHLLTSHVNSTNCIYVHQ